MGGICEYRAVQIHVSVLKHLTFPNYEFGKVQCVSYPIALSRFGEKIKIARNTKNLFIVMVEVSNQTKR